MKKRQQTMELPFKLIRVKGSPYFYVRFKNDITGAFERTRYTTKETIKENAFNIALEWYSKGIKRQQRTELIASNIIDILNNNILELKEVKKIITIFEKQGLIKSVIYPNDKNAIPISDYLLDFWDWDKSEYIQQKKRQDHSIHKCHTTSQYRFIKKHWIPYFKNDLLGSLTQQKLNDFINDLAKKDITNTTKNNVLRAGFTAIKYAFNHDYIKNDVTKGIILFSKNQAKRNILTPTIVKKLFAKKWQSEREELANILSMITGMRAGEIQGLQIQDIGEDIIYINHSWNADDKLKLPKNNHNRSVIAPIKLCERLLTFAHKSPHTITLSSFIFWTKTTDKKPIENRNFMKELRNELSRMGMDRDFVQSITFHSWRHFYTTYMKEKLNDKLLQTQTGHLTLAMLEHYGNHEKEGEKQKIALAQKNVFSALLPNLM